MAEARFKYPDSDAERPQRRGGAGVTWKEAGGGRWLAAALRERVVVAVGPGAVFRRTGAAPPPRGQRPGETWPVRQRGEAPLRYGRKDARAHLPPEGLPALRCDGRSSLVRGEAVSEPS